MVRGAFFFGRYWGGQKWRKLKSIFAKTRVGFGRMEVSLMLSCTEFCALSSRHGPRGQGFEGFSKTWDFHDFFGGRKCNKTWKCGMNMVRFQSPELSTLAKWSPKNSRKRSGVAGSFRFPRSPNRNASVARVEARFQAFSFFSSWSLDHCFGVTSLGLVFNELVAQN